MARRCPQCGTSSMMGTTVCPKCGNSLLPVIDEEISSLADMKVYSIIVLVFAVFDTISFVLNVIGYGSFVGGGIFSFLNLTGTNITTSTVNSLLFVIEIILIVSMFFEIVSFIYLRACFSKLMGHDMEFSTPKTGVTLLIVGLILVMIGASVIIASLAPLLLSSQSGSIANDPGLLLIFGMSAILAAIGGILLFIGYIMGALIGLHRIATKFEESLFDIGWIFLIISLFFAPLALVSGIVFVQGTRVSVQRLEVVKTTGLTQ